MSDARKINSRDVESPTCRERRTQLATPGKFIGVLRKIGLSLGLLAALILTLILATSLGPVNTPFSDVVSVLLTPLSGVLETLGIRLSDPGPAVSSLIIGNRLPRVVLAMLVGAGLAAAGAVMQAVFRNPLAEPGITGVSSGAATAAVLMIVTGVSATHPLTLPAGAFLGALITVTIVQGIGGTTRPNSPATLLLVGIALNAFLGAIIAAAVANAPDPDDIRRAMFWLNGDLTASRWGDVSLAVAPIVIGSALIITFARELDLMLVGEEVAAATGVRTTATRHGLLALAALVTAAGVAVTGVISFVGLVIPHVTRLLLGPSHVRLLPVSMGIGACFLALADLAARLLFSPIVLQTGTITALVGAPVLLVLVMRRSEVAR